jgi:hypothetical protein
MAKGEPSPLRLSVGEAVAVAVGVGEAVAVGVGEAVAVAVAVGVALGWVSRRCRAKIEIVVSQLEAITVNEIVIWRREIISLPCIRSSDAVRVGIIE